MYICICNAFTDQDVQDHLDDLGQKTRTEDVYTACSGGGEMRCGSCQCDLKAIVDMHNNTMTIREISKQMQQNHKKQKEKV